MSCVYFQLSTTVNQTKSSDKFCLPALSIQIACKIYSCTLKNGNLNHDNLRKKSLIYIDRCIIIMDKSLHTILTL